MKANDIMYIYIQFERRIHAFFFKQKKKEKANKSLVKMEQNVQRNDNEFYEDISAYGNLHASTATIEVSSES